MEAAERLAVQRGADALTLGVEPDNAVARRLYLKQGFLDFLTYRGSHGETIIGMQKRLLSN
jgi:ribosomal protein S18 acetylase RimI-like enzyme